MQRKLVILETPFAGNIPHNIKYARACMRDSLLRHNEFPIASHLLYTQTGILDDSVHSERELGIEAGLTWACSAEATVVYMDLGISKGMRAGINRAEALNRPLIYRQLPGNWEQEQADLLKKSQNHPFVRENIGM